MKKAIILLCLCFSICTYAQAQYQTKELAAFYDDYVSSDYFHGMALSPSLLHRLTKQADPEAKKQVADALKGVLQVDILRGAATGKHASAYCQEIDKLIAKMEKKSFTHIRANSDRCFTGLLTKEKKDDTFSEVMFYMSDGSSQVCIFMIGDINTKKLAKVAHLINLEEFSYFSETFASIENHKDSTANMR